MKPKSRGRHPVIATEGGASLVEIMLATMAFVFVMMAATGMMLEMMRRLAREENALSRNATLAELRHFLASGDIRPRAGRIEPTTSFALGAGGYQRMLTTYTARPVLESNLNAARGAESSVFMSSLLASGALNVGAGPGGAPGPSPSPGPSPKFGPGFGFGPGPGATPTPVPSPTPSPTPGLAAGIVPVHVGSFVIERPVFGTQVDSATGAQVLNKGPRSLFVSRCVENVARNFDAKTDSTIDLAAPRLSAFYVLHVLNRVPFLEAGPQGVPRVNCCPIATGPGCTDGRDLRRWLPVVYIIHYNSGTGNATAITEFPRPSERSFLWGAGFINTFNRTADPTHFKLFLFHVQDQCRLSQASTGQRCLMGPARFRDIANPLPAADGERYVGSFIRAISTSKVGSISTSLESGLIPLEN